MRVITDGFYLLVGMHIEAIITINGYDEFEELNSFGMKIKNIDACYAEKYTKLFNIDK